MNLVIDVGNTIVKYALFQENQLIGVSRSEDIDLVLLDAFLQNNDIKHVILSSVRSRNEEVDLWISQRTAFLFLSAQTAVPIRNLYSSPETLGYDRLASAVEGHTRFPDQAVLCIDIGTCITYDFVDQEGQYWGGGIAPGIDLRFKAMHNFTQKLPLVKLESLQTAVPLIGSTTKDSIRSGVIHGIAAEIDGTIGRYQERSPDLVVILTGGHSRFFESYVKSRIFAFPNLVLHGLNTILQYNAS